MILFGGRPDPSVAAGGSIRLGFARMSMPAGGVVLVYRCTAGGIEGTGRTVIFGFNLQNLQKPLNPR